MAKKDKKPKKLKKAVRKSLRIKGKRSPRALRVV